MGDRYIVTAWGVGGGGRGEAWKAGRRGMMRACVETVPRAARTAGNSRLGGVQRKLKERSGNASQHNIAITLWKRGAHIQTKQQGSTPHNIQVTEIK